MTAHTPEGQFATGEKNRPADIGLESGARPRVDPLPPFSPDRQISTQDLLKQVQHPAALIERAFSFGPFRLFPMQRLLLEGEKPLRLGSRALDILIALVERPGEQISNSELMSRVWPNAFVEPANLTVHVAALRRALGDGRGGKRYLVNIPGRGYRFVAPVKMSEEFEPSPPQPAIAEQVHNLPAQLTRVVNREEFVAWLSAELSRNGFITIRGSGEIE